MNIRRYASLALVCLCLALATGCDKQPRLQEPGEKPASAEGKARWQAFENNARQQDAQAKAFRLHLSLTYTVPGSAENRRITAIMWGNSPKVTRLDVNAGVGVLLARLRDGDEGLTIHSVGDKKAWQYSGHAKAMLNIGVPVPLSLPDMAALLLGRFSLLLPQSSFTDVTSGPKGLMRYALENQYKITAISLDAKGLVRHIQFTAIGSTQAWQMDIDYDSGERPLPQTLRLQHPNGSSATVYVQARHVIVPAFGEAQMLLRIPPEITVEALEP